MVDLKNCQTKRFMRKITKEENKHLEGAGFAEFALGPGACSKTGFPILQFLL